MISPRVNPVTASLNCAVTIKGFTLVGLETRVESITVGSMISTVKELTLSVLEAFQTVSVTTTVQFV